ncbi:hypothetical protein DM860_006312 [Cuscuta australis]|uniref:DCD domain-containing protein n=1 Tax=Cuscuta australis TaxID=267555 RepID=A0A328DND3_9ASTE|nr:hypothetical protein DM860_006312 [Cuscuta australis]
MARGKRKASASSSRLVLEDVGDAPADNVETSDSTPTTMDAEEPESVSADIVEVEDSTVGRISLQETTLSSCKNEENAVEMAAASINRDEVETVIEEMVNEPNVTTEPVTEPNGENVSEFALNGGANALNEVVSGEDATKMVTDNVEDILQEEDRAADFNRGSANEEDTEGLREASNHDDDLSKDGRVAGQKDEEITEETIKEKIETRQVLLKSRKRKRGKKGAIGSFKKLAFDGKNKKVHSNGDMGGENGDSTLEDVMEQDKGNENTEEKKVEVRDKKSKKRKKGGKGNTPAKSVLENVSSEARSEQISNGVTKQPRKAGLKHEDGLKKGVPEGKSVGDSQDVPESSGRKKPSGKVEGMGLIFMCNSETKKDCYKYNILGLPSSKREVVENIYKGMRLFLYDVDLKLMYGIYKAAARGGFNVEPKAFKSKFPSQVRFRILEDCNPLAEEKFKNVIKKNYYTKNKFRCELTTDQVKDLCKLFRAGRGSSNPQKTKRPLKKESSKVVDRNKTRKHGVDRPTRPKAERREDRVEKDRVISKNRVDQNRRLSPVRENTYRDYPRHYETDHIHPFSRIPEAHGSHQLVRPLPSSSAHPYAYDRPLETDAYRRVPLAVGDDPYRHNVITHDRRHYDDPYRPDRITHDRRHYDDLDHKSPYREDDPGAVYRRGLTNYIPRGHPSYLAGLSVHRGDYSPPDEYYSSSRAIESRSAVAPNPEYRPATSSRAVPEYRSGGFHPQYWSSAGMHGYPY